MVSEVNRAVDRKMRDYRVPLAVAVPAAFAVFAVLWILRKKSGKGGKTSGKSETVDKSLGIPVKAHNEEDVISSSTVVVDKQGITITQRKIPETQARDRGDADAKDSAPDVTAGRDGLTSCIKSEQCEEFAALSVVSDTEEFDSVHSLNLSAVQLEQVEKMIMSAMGDGIHEATGKLIYSQKQITDLELDPSLSASSGIEIVESFDQSYQETVAVQAKVMPSEKVVTCSSVATIGFDTGEEEKRSDIQEAAISKGATKPVFASVSSQVGTEPESVSEMAAEGQAQDSPQEQASFFPHTCIPSSVTSSAMNQSKELTPVDTLGKTLTVVDEASSSKPISQFEVSNEPFSPPPCTVPSFGLTSLETMNIQPQQGQQKPHEQATSAQNIPLTSSSNESTSGSAIATRRRMPTMSTGSLESQASLGPEDIDSLWGIKPLSAASANWDRQLSLDDPDSPFRKSAIASESDMSLLSSTHSADTEIISPSTVSSLLTEQPLTLTSIEFSQEQPTGHATQRISEPGHSTLTSSLLKEENNVEDRKDIEQTQKPNSPLCDNNSEGSNDSGRGGSEHEVVRGDNGEPLIQIDFNIPSDLCGRFIGRHGKNINFMKTKTGASISLTNNPFTAEFQICQVAGTQTEVDNALAMIRRKFPLQDHPLFTMVPINIDPASVVSNGELQPFIVPDVMQLSLPEGVSVEVYVSAIVDAGHVFLQQPTHRSFMSLEKLTYHLNNVYGQDPNVPSVPTPVECGVICVVESEGFWYRAMIMSLEDENGEAQIKFVDYGGYATMPVSALKQIRTDFMTLPFQAVECFMANISPLQGEEYFSAEATNAVGEMTNMKLLQCQVVARSEMGTPYIHLYQINPTLNSAMLINRALATDQHVQWVEMVSQEQDAQVLYSPEG